MHVVLSIGNTDNKLTQQEWAAFVDDVRWLVAEFTDGTHFFGGPDTWAKWQNVLWMFEMAEMDCAEFQAKLIRIREQYNQESAFMMTGNGKFV